MLTSKDPAVQLLLDRAELHDLQMTYSKAVDSRDWDLLRTVWVEQDFHARYREDFTTIEGVAKMISGVARFHTTYHFMGNQMLEVTGNEATTKTFAMLTHHFTVDGRENEFNVLRGKYLDKLRRVDGHWRIYDRNAPPDWTYVGVTKASSSDPAVRLLLDRAEIRDVAMQYALGIELGDWDRVRRCLAPDLVVNQDNGMTKTTADQYVDALRSATERYDFNRHFLGSHLVAVSGDEAEMACYAMVTHSRDDKLTGEKHEWTDPSVRYVNKLVRTGGRWVISEWGAELGDGKAATSLPTSQDPAVQHLLDRAAIGDVIARLSHGVDDRNDDLVRSCFAPKFQATLNGKSLTDLDELIGHIKSTVEDYDTTTHFLGNQLIDIRGDEAAVDTYSYVTHRDSPGTPFSDWTKGGMRYVDKLVRSGDRWLIRERTTTTNQTDIDGHTIRAFPAYGLAKPLQESVSDLP
jgi:hypothetical protein